jgi:hypothetical protein
MIRSDNNTGWHSLPNDVIMTILKMRTLLIRKLKQPRAIATLRPAISQLKELFSERRAVDQHRVARSDDRLYIPRGYPIWTHDHRVRMTDGITGAVTWQFRAPGGTGVPRRHLFHRSNLPEWDSDESDED